MWEIGTSYLANQMHTHPIPLGQCQGHCCGFCIISFIHKSEKALIVPIIFPIFHPYPNNINDWFNGVFGRDATVEETLSAALMGCDPQQKTVHWE